MHPAVAKTLPQGAQLHHVYHVYHVYHVHRVYTGRPRLAEQGQGWQVGGANNHMLRVKGGVEAMQGVLMRWRGSVMC